MFSYINTKKIQGLFLVISIFFFTISFNTGVVYADYIFNTSGVTQDVDSRDIPEASLSKTNEKLVVSTLGVEREHDLYTLSYGSEDRVPRNKDILFRKIGNTLTPIRTTLGAEIKIVSRQGSNLEEIFEYSVQELDDNNQPTGNWLETAFDGRGFTPINNGNKFTLDGNDVATVKDINGATAGVNREGESIIGLISTSASNVVGWTKLKERFGVSISCGFDAMCYAANASHHLFMTPGARMLTLSGTMFDYVLSSTILKMNDNLFVGGNATGEGSAINIGWKIFRDISNIIFIFVLLYISINTILKGVGNSGRDIITVIVIAVLINFSMFFTKVFIDFSNLIALNFYNQISETVTPEDGVILYPESDNPTEVSIAGVFIAKTKLATLYNKADNNRGGITAAADNIYIIQQSIGGGILMFILAIILFIVSIMLITRFIILAFVLMMSSIAIGSYVLPKLRSQIFDKWRDALVGQSLMAPVFIFFIYLSLIFITKMPSSNSDSDLSDVVLVTAQGIMPYIMSIGFIIFSLIAAKQLGDKAGKSSGLITKGIGAMAVGGAAKFGRVAGGGSARFLSNNLEGNSAASIAIKNRLDRAASSSWDMRNSSSIKRAGKATGVGDVLGNGGGKGGFDAIVKKTDGNREANYKQAGKKTGSEQRSEDMKNRLFAQNPELNGIEGYKTLLKTKVERDQLDAKMKQVTKNPLSMTESDVKEQKAIQVKLDNTNATIKAISDKIKPEDMEKLEKMSGEKREKAEKTISRSNKAGQASTARQSNYVQKSTAGRIETTDREGNKSSRLNIPFTPSHSRFAQKTRAAAAKKDKQTDYDKLLDGLNESREKNEKEKESKAESED